MRGLKGLPGLFSALSFLLPLTLAAAPAAANPSTEPAFISALELPNARSIDPVVGEMFPRWMSVRIYLNGEHPGDADMAELTRWAQAMRDMPVTTRLRAINMKVNNLISYATDSELWHETDYWETPNEAVDRGAADCEGYAILKMYLAKDAGIPLDQMAILVGTLGHARVPHAILGAKVGQIIVTLDNKTGSIVALNNRTDFTPIYSVGVRGAYTYPTNWAASVGVTSDQPTTPLATGVSVTAADSNAHAVLRPASAATTGDGVEPAVDVEPLAAVEPAAVEADADSFGSTAIAESLEPVSIQPTEPAMAQDSPTVVPAEQEEPEHQLFSSDFDTKLDQVVSLLLR